MYRPRSCHSDAIAETTYAQRLVLDIVRQLSIGYGIAIRPLK